ncbi:MAG: protein-export chaperone SecB [Proteobacteria bacterium]|nr:protein-export chaperone SecB [Pseudomonadota bacterium]
MTDEAAAGSEGAAQGPKFEVIHQYIKDLSLEVPGAPQIFQAKSAPEVAVNVDVGVQPAGDNDYEIVLRVDARGQSGGDPLFIVELAYGGLFRTSGDIAQEHLQGLLMIEGPRMLFPFARNVIATVTRDGGLPPLMISPIDFVKLFRDRIARSQAEAAAQGNGDGAPA